MPTHRNHRSSHPPKASFDHPSLDEERLFEALQKSVNYAAGAKVARFRARHLKARCNKPNWKPSGFFPPSRISPVSSFNSSGESSGSKSRFLSQSANHQTAKSFELQEDEPEDGYILGRKQVQQLCGQAGVENWAADLLDHKPELPGMVTKSKDSCEITRPNKARAAKE